MLWYAHNLVSKSCCTTQRSSVRALFLIQPVASGSTNKCKFAEIILQDNVPTLGTAEETERVCGRVWGLGWF